MTPPTRKVGQASHPVHPFVVRQDVGIGSGIGHKSIREIDFMAKNSHSRKKAFLPTFGAYQK